MNLRRIHWLGALLFALTSSDFGTCSKWDKSQKEEKAPPQVGDACEPSDERWYPVADDQTAFLFCEVARKKLKLHSCNSNDRSRSGDRTLFKVFDPKRQQCVVANEEYRWLLMTPPLAPSKKVGDTCAVNRDCSDGMYCNAANGGICACYLNYIEINMACVRISSVCQGTTFYPEHINGKPKICSAGSPCPPGYVCRLEGGSGIGQEQGFCCLATANEVCGQATPHIMNGQPVACYSPNATESCPSTHTCQYYQAANRHYCCQNKTPEPIATSTPQSAPASTRARQVQHPDSFCTNNGIAYLYDGYPIVCNPNNSASCPKDFPCQKNERINLHFCCQNTATTIPNPNPAMPPFAPPSPPPPPPLPPFSSLFVPETVAPPVPTTGPVAVTQQPIATNLGNLVGGAMANRAVDFCGQNARPFVFDGRPVTCSMNDSLSCPPGYACTVYQPFNASFCCRNAPPSESHLPYEPPTQPSSSVASSTTPSASPSSTTAKVPSPAGAQSVCGTWGVAYLFEGYPVTCVHHGLNSTCPPDHICQLHSPSNAHFCCRSPDPLTASSPAPTTTTTGQPYLAISNPDGCPPQTYAARDHNGVIQVCDLLLAPDSCPTGTGCLYSALFGRYQCCGARVERWPQPTTSTSAASSTTTATSTSSSTASSTPNSTPPSTTSFFTPPPPPSTPATNSSASNIKKHPVGAKLEECPSGQVVYRDPSANDSSACAANHADSCPGGYFCQWSQNAGKFLCCGVSAGCPNNGVAYVSAATWEVQRCSQSEPSACPPGYSCQATSDGSYVCCASSIARGAVPSAPVTPVEVAGSGLGSIIGLPPASHLCQVGLPLNDQPGGYRTCSSSAPCPSGYDCTPSSVGTVCCPVYQGKNTAPFWYFHSPIGSRNARV